MTRSAFFSFLFACLKYGRKIDIKHAEKHRETLQRNKKTAGIKNYSRIKMRCETSSKDNQDLSTKFNDRRVNRQ